MLSIIGEQRSLAGQSDGSNGHVGKGELLAFLLPITAQQTGLPGDCWSYRQKVQAVDESFGLRLFAGPKSGVDFGDVDRTTGQDVSLLDELVQQFGAAMPSIEVIKDDGRIEEDGRHQRFC